MITEKAVVREITPEGVVLVFSRREACGSCRARGWCLAHEHVVVADAGTLTVRKGDTVEVAVKQKASLIGSFFIFFVPALFFLISLIFFRRYSELLSFLLALGVIFIYYLIVWFFFNARKSSFKITITGIVSRKA